MNRPSWEAEWIWAEGTGNENNVYVEARQSFELTIPFTKAFVRISANQSYKLYINGIEAGRGPAPSDLLWMSFDTHDVAALLRNGRNCIAVAAHNFGKDRIVTEQLQGPGGLICQLDVYGADDQGAGLLTVASSSEWKCRRSPRWKTGVSRLHMWGGYRELMDVSREDGWECDDYDDSSWPPAEVIAAAEQEDSPWPRLVARDIPYLQEDLVSPVRVVSAESLLGFIQAPEAQLAADTAEGRGPVVMDASIPGSFPQITYDFGAEIVGYPELEVIAEEGGVLQLFYGESLELDLRDTYLLRKGVNKITPFGRRAFRYLKVGVMATPVPLRICDLRVRFVHYPYKDGGHFHSSDDKLNRIWEVGRYTTMVNSQNHFEDCPYREGALWVADSVVMSKVVYQTFNDPRLVRKSLLQAAKIQNADGSIPGTGPQRNAYLLPDFCAHWLFGVAEYYDYTKDRAFLEELWPHIVKLAAWFTGQEDDAGLFANADRDGMWCFIDWSDEIHREDRVTAVSCFYYKFLHTAAALAYELGEEKSGNSFTHQAAELRKSVRNLLRVPNTAIYADCLNGDGLSSSITAQTNFAAAWSGIMDDEEVSVFLQEYYLKGRLPQIRGAFFYHIVLETLFRYGYAADAVRIIRNYWGEMLDRGATTWWETFDPNLPFSTTPSPYLGHTPTYLEDAVPVSLCHGWGASPTYLLNRELLGINISMAGDEQVTLRPSPVTEVEWAEGSVVTRYGKISAQWKRDVDGVYRFEARLPAQMTWKAPGLRDISVSMDQDHVHVRGAVPVHEAAPKRTPLVDCSG
ncbi:alpha-L-rhamnosidase-related protein [Paenibacillus sp. S28]|uniref:alpha-L-rhamnosidase-related protein n=1 Tax=Paenibacillus sp. S28 TaxID=2767463 RepID=UPI00190A165F|nr:alpha-L-rhamnosidase N-terminal domain-containing protein [Paenibacillus sp. S28]MBJ9993510.1 alpha-L-rhamnosidase N-terminal domain-containing protein [Paenibacillus sp. S28]